MIFELLAWVYISLICFGWGGLFVHLVCRSRQQALSFGLPIICFTGMAVVGFLTLCLSLCWPLTGWVKWIIQIPAFFYLGAASNRRFLIGRLMTGYQALEKADLILLAACTLVILFLVTAPIIHPDTLYYHSYSIWIFSRYGIVPGIANLQVQFGLQSLWFAVLAVFDLPFLQISASYPLSGCMLVWFVVFLISKQANTGPGSGVFVKLPAVYLCLLLFSMLSWTQLRLTAASASPDFVAAICTWLAAFFFIRRSGSAGYDDYFAVFFAGIAFSVKLSAICILLIPAFIVIDGVLKRKFRLVMAAVATLTAILIPVIARNVITTGYPFFPSGFADVFHPDWKLGDWRVEQVRRYITAYARYPVESDQAFAALSLSPGAWIPLWWKHLYVVDKMIMLAIVAGGLIDLIFWKRWISAFSVRTVSLLAISLTGVLFWFIRAPDPRFGTGFLLALIYLQYAPFLPLVGIGDGLSFSRWVKLAKYVAALLIAGYVVYRAVYFFRPGQLIFPTGITRTKTDPVDCNGTMKEMLFSDKPQLYPLPDSCKTFLFRGDGVKAGFRPAN